MRSIAKKNEKSKTALASHDFVQNHSFDFNKLAICDLEKHYLRINLNEMICIKLNDTINNRTDEI